MDSSRTTDDLHCINVHYYPHEIQILSQESLQQVIKVTKNVPPIMTDW